MSQHDHALPNIDSEQFQIPSHEQLQVQPSPHKPRILLLYGSLRERSYSRLVVEESARLLTAMGLKLVFLIQPDYRKLIQKMKTIRK